MVKTSPKAHQNADADCRGHSEIDDGGCRPKRRGWLFAMDAGTVWF
ncbi:MAG: hypothetical protein ACLR8U_15585 [Oscillospiraceae bacterium]